MRELKEYSDINRMCSDAAHYIRDYIIRVLEQKDSFSLVLSGGVPLQSLYRTLFYMDNLPWEKIHFFITDEKCLSEQNHDSNFKNAVKNLLRRSNIPLQNIHWINTDIMPLKKSAQEYEKTLRHYLTRNGRCFDLVLLSLGPDGHIASLFPGFTALMEKKKLVVLTEKAILDPRVPRITMTLPALNSTSKVLFFISDENCGSVLEEIMTRPHEDKFSYPAEMVLGLENKQVWFILRS